MQEFEKDVKDYNQLKNDLIAIVKELDMCNYEKVNMYQDIALCYTVHLKDMKRLLKIKYNLKI